MRNTEAIAILPDTWLRRAKRAPKIWPSAVSARKYYHSIVGGIMFP